MTKNSQDEIVRAYAILQALRKNIDQITKNSIEETYVNEFHSALDKLTSIGIDVSEFHIPDSELTPIPDPTIVPVTYPGESGRQTRYTKEKYLDKQYFLMKIDSVLGYFERITSPEPKRAGFRTSKD